MTMALWKSIRPYLSAAIRFFHISYIEAKAQHHGARLGVLWGPLSSLCFVVMLSLIFHHSESMPQGDFFLYVFVGYILWSFIAETITGSTDIIQKRLDFAVHNGLSVPGLFGKILVDRLFSYGLNLVSLALVAIVFFHDKLGASLVLFLPFALMIVAASFFGAYLVNIVTILFPDTRALFQVGVRFLFFASPVFWSANEVTGGVRGLLTTYNPVSYFLSMARQTMGIQVFNPTDWLIALAVTAAICAAGTLAYLGSRNFIRNLK